MTKIPVRRAHRMAIGTTLAQENIILRLYTDDGLEGLGEAPHMVGVSLKGESPGTVMLMLRDRLLPAVRGMNPFEIERIQQVMERAVPWNYRAKSAVNLALYDLVGKALGSTTWSSSSNRSPGGIWTAWRRSAGPPSSPSWRTRAPRPCSAPWRSPDAAPPRSSAST